MTAPRIVSAYEAEELRRVSAAAVEIMIAADAGEAETRAETRAAVLVRDLAASVVALHAEVERLTARAADERLDARIEVQRAATAERARIVAWMRNVDPAWSDEYWTAVRQGLRYAADRIEDGAHMAKVAR